jgi:hypothetical protein
MRTLATKVAARLGDGVGGPRRCMQEAGIQALTVPSLDVGFDMIAAVAARPKLGDKSGVSVVAADVGAA